MNVDYKDNFAEKGGKKERIKLLILNGIIMSKTIYYLGAGASYGKRVDSEAVLEEFLLCLRFHHVLRPLDLVSHL